MRAFALALLGLVATTNGVQLLAEKKFHCPSGPIDVATFGNKVSVKEATDAIAPWYAEAAGGDGKINPDEMDPRFISAFRSIDLDRDNLISKQDLVDFFVECGVKIGDGRK